MAGEQQLIVTRCDICLEVVCQTSWLVKTSLRDGFRELGIGLYIEVVSHNLFLVSIKCPRWVTRSTPAGNESRAKLGTKPAWNLAAACLPKADRGSVILFASIVSRPHFWHVINRFISPNQQRSISVCVGDSDLGVAMVGDAEVNNIPADATFFELLPDGFQAALFARTAHFQVYIRPSLVCIPDHPVVF